MNDVVAVNLEFAAQAVGKQRLWEIIRDLGRKLWKYKFYCHKKVNDLYAENGHLRATLLEIRDLAYAADEHPEIDLSLALPEKVIKIIYLAFKWTSK